MRTAALEGEKSLAALVERLYGPKLTMAQVGAAEKALLAINPHLARDISSLPEGTPIIIPADAGLPLSSTGTADHRLDVLVAMLDAAVVAANQVASSAPTQPPPAFLAAPVPAESAHAGKGRKRQSKAGKGRKRQSKAEKKQQKATADALRTLADDVSAFKKMHRL
jgi:hypothetical protein